MIPFMTLAPKPVISLRLTRQRLRQDFPEGFSVQGRLEAGFLPRLAQEGIVLESGAVSYEFDFDGRDRLALLLEGQAHVDCARCLQPLSHRFGLRRSFRCFENEAQADQAMASDVEEEPLCDQDEATGLALMEDELLIALTAPLVHGNCSAPRDTGDVPRDDTQNKPTSSIYGSNELKKDEKLVKRPFAGLAGLMSQAAERKKS